MDQTRGCPRVVGEPGYDPATLQLPRDFPKCKDAKGKPFTVSPGQAQWWKFKAAHFDSVIMFKMGKFYELFEMDAHVGASDLAGGRSTFHVSLHS